MPPGTRWLHAKRPAKPPVKLRRSRPRMRKPTRLIKFVIGARVSPLPNSIVVMTQRFRGRVIRELLAGSWQRASTAQREAARLLAGKEADGSPLRDHRHPHARFGVLFDQETDKAARLLVWREQPSHEHRETRLPRIAHVRRACPRPSFSRPLVALRTRAVRYPGRRIVRSPEYSRQRTEHTDCCAGSELGTKSLTAVFVGLRRSLARYPPPRRL